MINDAPRDLISSLTNPLENDDVKGKNNKETYNLSTDRTFVRISIARKIKYSVHTKFGPDRSAVWPWKEDKQTHQFLLLKL